MNYVNVVELNVVLKFARVSLIFKKKLNLILHFYMATFNKIEFNLIIILSMQYTSFLMKIKDEFYHEFFGFNCQFCIGKFSNRL